MCRGFVVAVPEGELRHYRRVDGGSVLQMRICAHALEGGKSGAIFAAESCHLGWIRSWSANA